MMRITYSNEICKPPEVVFPWIVEPEKARQWQQNVSEEDILIDTPDVVGTTFKERIREGGNSLEMQGTITRFILNQVIEFHLESRLHTLEVSYALEEVERATKITVDARIEWKLPVKLVSLFIGKRMRKGIAEQMEAEVLELKRLCETS